MTLIGKVFLYFNLLLSALLAAWSLALYANYLDWSDGPPKGEKPAGLIGERQARIKEVVAGIGPFERSWRTTEQLTHLQEDQRQADLAWYAAELKHLVNGATEGNPCRSVVLDRNLPVPDPKNFNRPKMAPVNDRAGQPLLSMTVYDERSKKTLEDLAVVLKQYDDKIKEDIKLTDKLAGTPDMKGLQQRVVDERAKREGVVEEQLLIEPLWKVSAVDTELLLKRRETIDERIRELSKYLHRKHGYDVANRP